MSHHRARTGVPRRRRLGIAAAVVVVLASVIWQANTATAQPICTGDDPPPICFGDPEPEPPDPPDPVPAPPPPSAPDLNGGGEPRSPAILTLVAPQRKDYTSTTHITVQRSALPWGTWTTAWDSDVVPQPPDWSSDYRPNFGKSLSFAAPLDQPCLRARITTAAGVSAWSPVKCVSSAAQADNVHATWQGSTTAAVMWSDHSVEDVTYYLEARDTRTGETTLTRVPGTRGTTGTRTAQISGISSGTTCVRVWAVEAVPGRTYASLNLDDWGPDGPLLPAIYPSAPSCLDVPYS